MESLFFNPREAKLCYRGKHTFTSPGVVVTMPIENIAVVPGASQVGWYNLETGEIKEAIGSTEELETVN